MSLDQDIRALAPGSLVELFELDATAIGGSIVRFHNGSNGLRQPVVWQGNTYSAFPIEASGFEFNGKGQLPRPKIKVANVTGLMGVLVRDYGDLLGAKLTRKRTLAKYLDAANFPARRNLLTFTEDLRNTAEAGGTRPWSQFVDADAGVTLVTAIDAVGVTHTVSKLQTSTTGAAQRQVSQSLGTSPPASTVYVVALSAKAAEAVALNITWSSKTPQYPNVRFNLSAGTATPASAGGQSPVAYGMAREANGWWRCWAAFDTATGAGSPGISLQLVAPAGGFYSGAVGDGIFLDRVQCELGSAPTEYQPVLASTWTANPTADPAAALPDDVFFVDRKSAENKVLIEFELAAAFDVAGVQLPRRPITQNVCPWKYRVNDVTSGCSYTGTAYFDANDQPVGSAGLDVCGKRLSSCKARHGTTPLPFGGFPGAGLTR